MAITWKEIWNRYFFFKASDPGDDIPPSITSNLATPKPADYDVNFQKMAGRMMSDEPGLAGGAGAFGMGDYMSWIAGAEHSKDTRVRLFREMESNAWVADALSEYTSTALNSDEKGETILLNINNEDLSNNDNIRDNLQKEFEHITKTVFKYNLNFGEWFREYVLMGECAVELLIPQDNVKVRTEGVKRVKLLRSEQYVAYHDTDGNLEGFVIRNPYDNSVRVLADKSQIAYVDSGVYEYISGIGFGWAKNYIPSPERVLRIPKSFLEGARKPYKQLDALEDSVVIYRMSRAPERLVFNVATGNLPKSKAEQYLQKLINKFRKKLTYNPNTGEVDQGQNVKNIMEDFWFVKDQSGKGTDVTTLGGAQNLGEIEDVNYFLGKLWKAMKIPPARMTGEGVFDQNPGSMSTAEIKFQKWIYYIMLRFSHLIKNIFMQHLKIKGIWAHYNLKEEDLDIFLIPPSYFTYMKNAEFLEAQFARFANFANNIDVDTPIFARKTALKEGLGWSDEQIAQNQEWLAEEEAEKEGEGAEGEEGEDGLGDLGDEGGGGDLEL
jgi:hypothetical protein